MEVVSYIGTSFTAISSVPQLYKACTRSDSLAPGSSLLRILAASVWGYWAVIKEEWIFLVSCCIVVFVELLILIYQRTVSL